jgi:outer membrane protein TolC
LVAGVVLTFAAGCASDGQIDAPPPLQSADPKCAAPSCGKEVLPTVHITQASANITVSDTKADVPFASATELSEESLVQEVLRRNPTVAMMAAAAQAASARYPQVTSLDDPKLGAFIAPASIGSNNVDFAYRVEVSQALPFPGKLGLRGETARNEAAAAGAELEDARLSIVEAARTAFADYCLAARAIEVNAENLKLLNEIRENAASRARTGQGEEQDVYQAAVTIARQRERTSTLERMQRVAQARINTLLNLPADQKLPQPPKELTVSQSVPPSSELRELAMQRPDIAAVRARVAADEAAFALAMKDYYPDVEVMAAYDTFWQYAERDLRGMVGLRFNIPGLTSRRDAALAEAQAKLAQRRAELAKLTAQVGLQVQEAYEQLQETERSLKLYEETAMPAARESVRLARTGYANNKVSFLSLIEAQRSLVELRDRQNELIAEARRRRAALDRAIGRTMPPSTLPAPSLIPPVILMSSPAEGTVANP